MGLDRDHTSKWDLSRVAILRIKTSRQSLRVSPYRHTLKGEQAALTQFLNINMSILFKISLDILLYETFGSGEYYLPFRPLLQSYLP
jgi:hypothetical protein